LHGEGRTRESIVVPARDTIGYSESTICDEIGILAGVWILPNLVATSHYLHVWVVIFDVLFINFIREVTCHRLIHEFRVLMISFSIGNFMVAVNVVLLIMPQLEKFLSF